MAFGLSMVPDQNLAKQHTPNSGHIHGYSALLFFITCIVVAIFIMEAFITAGHLIERMTLCPIKLSS